MNLRFKTAFGKSFHCNVLVLLWFILFAGYINAILQTPNSTFLQAYNMTASFYIRVMSCFVQYMFVPKKKKQNRFVRW